MNDMTFLSLYFFGWFVTWIAVFPICNRIFIKKVRPVDPWMGAGWALLWPAVILVIVLALLNRCFSWENFKILYQGRRVYAEKEHSGPE